MINYNKILESFLFFNIFTTITRRSSRNKKSRSLSFFKKNKTFCNARLLLISVYNVINLITVIKKQNETILFVGTSKEIQKFFFFFKLFKGSSSFFFIYKWLPGFLTNWSLYQKFIEQSIKQDFSVFNKTKKLRFFRFIFGLQNKPKPSLVLVFDSITSSNNLLVNECFLENIPLVFISSSFLEKDYSLIPYKVSINCTNVYSQWIFFQLFFIQFSNLTHVE